MTPRMSAPSALTLMALALAVALSGYGMAAQDAQTVISYVGTHGMATVGPNVSPAQRIVQLRELLQDYFDVPGIAEFALGRYRSSANAQQQPECLRLDQDSPCPPYAPRLGRHGPPP